MSVTAQLAEITDLLPYLPLMTTTRNPLDGEPRHAMPGSRPPLKLDPLILQDEAHAVLASWVQLAHDEHLVDADDYPADYTLALSLWLQRHAPTIEAHDAGDDFRSEVNHLWRRIKRATGERIQRRPHCTTIVDGQRCGNRVTGINADGHETEIMEHWAWCMCKACGMTYTFDAALKRLGQLQNLTIPQYAAETGIPERTLRRRAWLLTPVGRIGPNPTYARTDLDGVSTMCVS